MARRRIGQEDFIAQPASRTGASLIHIAALLDRVEIEHSLSGISAAAKGDQGWPPVALFRALVLATWHDLCPVRLAEALDDRASFRRELVGRGLERALFEAVTRQLETKGVIVRSGTLVDATVIQSASIRHDGDARGAGHRRRKPTHGHKAHAATDEIAGLVRGVGVTTANVHDAAELAAELVILTHGGIRFAVGTGVWGGPEAPARLRAHNAAVRRVRCPIEKVVGTWKRSHGLRRMRWLGLAKAGPQVRLAAMAQNLRRTLTPLQAAAA